MFIPGPAITSTGRCASSGFQDQSLMPLSPAVNEVFTVYATTPTTVDTYRIKASALERGC